MASFVKGTLLLMVVIFVSKCLGFLYRMQFMRIAGEEVVGIYMTAYPAFIFFIALVQLGLPIAITKIVASFAAKRQVAQAQAVLTTAFRVSTISIIVLIPLIIMFLPILTNKLLQNHHTHYPLLVAVFTVPIVVYGGIIRAYLLGLSKTAPTAWSSMIEQAIRILATTFLLPIFLTSSIEMNAAYAMGATALGEIAASLYLWLHFNWRYKTSSKKQYYPVAPLFRIALPSTGSRLFGTFTWFLEPIIFLKALTTAGLTAAAATTLYGVISGVHIPLLLFPAFIPAALSIVLIPAVSNAAAVHNTTLLNERIKISLRLSTLVGCYAATFFLLYGDMLAYELFHLKEPTTYMRILAPIFFFYYVQSPLLSILQALDEAKVAMMNSVYGGIGKLLVMFFLAAQPSFHVFGAIMAIGFGVLLTSFLHIATLRRMPNIHVGFRLFAAAIGCFIVTAVIQSFITYESIYISGVVSFFMLTGLLILTKQLKAHDIRYVRSLFSRL